MKTFDFDTTPHCPNCLTPASVAQLNEQRAFRCMICGVTLTPRLVGGVPTLKMSTSSYIDTSSTFIAMNKKPWAGDLMQPSSYCRTGTNFFACWIEPDMQGKRMVALVDKRDECVLWSSKGEVVRFNQMMVGMKDELIHLARAVQFNGNDEWKLGVAIELIFMPLVQGGSGPMMHVFNIIPLVSLLMGEDFGSLNGRREMRFEVLQDDSYKRLTNMVAQPLTTTPSSPEGYAVNENLMDAACHEWGVSSVIIKHNSGHWKAGKSADWVRYEEDGI